MRSAPHKGALLSLCRAVAASRRCATPPEPASPAAQRPVPARPTRMWRSCARAAHDKTADGALRVSPRRCGRPRRAARRRPVRNSLRTGFAGHLPAVPARTTRMWRNSARAEPDQAADGLLRVPAPVRAAAPRGSPPAGAELLQNRLRRPPTGPFRRVPRACGGVAHAPSPTRRQTGRCGSPTLRCTRAPGGASAHAPRTRPGGGKAPQRQTENAPHEGGRSPFVDLRGFEPLTSSLRTKRATNCATGP